jgi:hypothetical protein
MKTFSKLITAILLLIGLQSVAQQEKYISGQIIDKVSKKPLEFCAVGFYIKNDSLIKGATTDEKGFFESSLTNGKYKIKIQYMGYESISADFSVHKANQFLGIYKLEAEQNALGTVTIKGDTKSFKIDKNVYTVTKKMKIGTANTKDVLAKVSGVNYDRYNNAIKVDGDKNIVILVNGLQKDPEYIASLAPDRLKKVEIIRDPSGKYGLEGYSAVINIILKTNYQGIELSAEDQVITDFDAWDKKYYIPINNASASINYTYNKINVYANFSNYLTHFSMPISKTKEIGNNTFIEKGIDDNPNSLKENFGDHITLGADYYINPKNTISFESNLRGVLFNKGSNLTKNHINHLQNGSLVNSFNTEKSSNSNDNSGSYSIFYIGKLNEKNTLNADITYARYTDNFSSNFLINNNLNSVEEGNNISNNTKINIELDHIINKKSSYQLGLGNTYKKVENIFNSGTTTIDPANETSFTYNDTRYKLYGYYALKMNKKLSFKVGMASEMSLPEAFGNKTQYIIYQPYADIKYNVMKMLSIKLKYRSSSIYPSLSEANPNIMVIDNQTEMKGNPLLQPAVKHKISLRFNGLMGALSVEPYYHISNNYIGQVGKMRNDGIFEYTYENVGNYNKYGIKGNFVIPFSKSLIWQNSINFYKSSITYEKNTNSINDWTMDSNLIYMNKKHQITSGLLYQRGNTKIITPYGYNKWNNTFAALMFQKPFFKGKINIMALYMLPLDLGEDYLQGSYMKTATFTETNVYDISLIKNIFLIRATYRFTKGKTTRKTKKEIEEENNNSKKGLF